MTNGKLMGIAVDLSPNYYKYLQPYRLLHPNSSFGLPGRSNTNTNTNTTPSPPNPQSYQSTSKYITITSSQRIDETWAKTDSRVSTQELFSTTYRRWGRVRFITGVDDNDCDDKDFKFFHREDFVTLYFCQQLSEPWGNNKTAGGVHVQLHSCWAGDIQN